MSESFDQSYPGASVPPPPPVHASPQFGQYPPPGAYPPPYGQYQGPYPPMPYMQPAVRKTNGLAIASMVLGILWIYWIGSVLALVFGYVARRQIRENNQAGDGMAIAGIVLGWVGVGVFGLFLISAIAGAWG